MRSPSFLLLAVGALVVASFVQSVPAHALSCSRSDRLLFSNDLPANGRIIVRSFKKQPEAVIKKRVFLKAADQAIDYTVKSLFKGDHRFYILQPKRWPEQGSTLAVQGSPTATLKVTSSLSPPTKSLQLQPLAALKSTQQQTVWGYTWSRSFKVSFDRNTAAKARDVEFKQLVAIVEVMEEHVQHGRRWVSTAVPINDGEFSIGQGLCSGTFNVTRWVLTGRDPKVAEVAAKVSIMDRAGHILGRAQTIFTLPPPLASTAVKGGATKPASP